MMKMTKLLFLTFWTIGTLHALPIKTPRHVYTGLNENITNNPGDYPLPTDMTFRKYANHTIDQMTEYFDPDRVNRGDTIYLADWYISWFVKYVHPKIKHPYILISNDSDGSHPDTGCFNYDEKWGAPPDVWAVRTLLYDSKVAAWFCKNMLLSRHPKIIQIPIGQNIIYWSLCPKSLFSILQKDSFEKKYLLYMNIQLPSHPSRRHVAELFQDQPYCFSRIKNLEQIPVSKEQFYEELSQAVFTVAPPGYGPDTVRFWEAVALDCIPIVKYSELDDLYADLPVLFVNEWEDVNQKLLEEELAKIKEKKVGKEKAFFDYWARKIDAYQKDLREGRNAFSTLQATSFDEETLSVLSNLINQKTSRVDQLLCIGAAMGLRPFELAERCPSLSRIYIQDPWGAWGHEIADAHLQGFANSSMFSQTHRMRAIYFNDHPYFAIEQERSKKTHVFLDLSYLRHKLPDDLDTVYQHSLKGSLVCGNMSRDAYVKKILDKFSKSHRAQVNYLGDIWYFIK